MNVHKKRAWRALLLPAAALLFTGSVMTGCGGGGGGGNKQEQTSLQSTRAASIHVVQQSRELPTLIEAINGSDFASDLARSRSVASLVGFAQVAQRKWSAVTSAPTRQTEEVEYSPELGLYYRVTEGLTSYRADFYKDAAATQGAGNATFALTGLTSGRVTFAITEGNLPLNGTLNLSRSGEDDTHITGTVRDTSTNDSISPDLTIDANNTATGSIAIKDDQGTITYRDVTALETGAFSADIAYQSATGNVTQNMDGSGRVQLGTSSDRRYEANYAADGAGTLTLFDSSPTGQAENIADFDTL